MHDERTRARFLAKVDQTGDCWQWTAGCARHGYGRFNVTRDKPLAAHRVAYEMFVGPIPTGLHVLHRCDNPPCVNPGHLFLGTHQDNMDDMVRKGRSRAPRGEQVKVSKLTESAVRQIRDEVSQGRSQRAVARDFGVHHATVHRIVSGELWAHVL